MANSLFQLGFIRAKRSMSPAKLIPIMLAIGYLVFILQFYVRTIKVSIEDFGFVRLVLCFGVVDILIKSIFQKRIIAFPMYVSTQPISRRERNMFELADVLSNFWNYYSLFLFIPVFLLLHNASLIASLLLLNLLVSFANCFVLRIFAKSRKLIRRVATLLLPAYYLLLIDFASGHNVSVWIYVGLQLAVTIVSVFFSFRMKVYDEGPVATKISHFGGSRLSSYGMECLPFLRCKRLRIYLLLTLYLIILFISLVISDTGQERYDLLLGALISIGTFEQFNFGIEANYWQMFEVSPKGVKSIFSRKFKFYLFAELTMMIICSPLIFITDLSALYYVSVFLFVGTFYNLTQMLNLLFIKRLDIWSSAFLNYQGSSLLTIIFQILPPSVILIFGWYCEHNSYFGLECTVYIVLSIASLLFRNKAFNLFYNVYRKNRFNIIGRFVQ